MKKLLIITMLLGVGYSQSKIESNQQNVTILTRYMTVTGTIIKYDDEKVIDKISFGDMNVKVYIEECP